MKNVVLGLVVLAVAGVAGAQVNVPSGLTGLWQFTSSATELNGTIGGSLISLNEGAFFTGPSTQIGTVANPTLYSDNGVIQTFSDGYVQAPVGITANGGGSYVNDYTIMIDYDQTQTGAYNSLYQTAYGPYDNPGDLYITGGGAGSTIGNSDIGYSSLTFNASTWHRIVWSVSDADADGNGGWFRVYVDGTLYVDGPAQDQDGTYSLYPYFYLFGDSDPWNNEKWGLLGTLGVWDTALTSDQIAAMGGWIDGSATPTALTVPEPATMSFMAFGVLALALLRRNRK